MFGLEYEDVAAKILSIYLNVMIPNRFGVDAIFVGDFLNDSLHCFPICIRIFVFGINNLL